MLRINYFVFCLVSVCNNNSVDIVNQNKINVVSVKYDISLHQVLFSM